MKEDEVKKSKRDLMLERIRGRYPEKSFDDDESFFGQISDDYDAHEAAVAAHESELAGYKEREDKLREMYTSDPRSARLMMDWRDGDDVAVALVRLYGTDIKDAIDDPEKQEAMAEANREYMERVAKEKDYEEQYTANLEASLALIESVQTERGLSDDDIDKAMGWLIGVVRDAVVGKFTPESIDMALKAQNFDAAVEEAALEGEVRGKNIKVEEKLRKPKSGDGMPALDGKNGSAAVRTAPRSIFEIASGAR